MIGNPPYDVIAEKEQGIDLSEEKEFFGTVSSYKDAVGESSIFTVYSLFFP